MGFILVVEDDKVLNLGLKACLEEYEYKVIGAKDGKEAIDYIKSEVIDLIILDVNLPDIDGFQVCKKIRDIIEIPIVFLTARDEEKDIVKGFDLGADDYITKPFNITIVQKKISAILKRCSSQMTNQYTYNSFHIDLDKKCADQNGKAISFTPTEYRILEMMVINRGHVLMKDNIIQDLWDKSGNWVDEHTLVVNISRIRSKIKDPERKMIVTVFGVGYMWGSGLNEDV